MTSKLAEAAYRDYSEPLHRYLMRRLADAQAAQGLAHDAYLRLVRVDDAQVVRAPQAYLFRIASNLIYELRKRRRRDAVVFDSRMFDRAAVSVSDPAATAPGEQIDRERLVATILASLPPLYAAIFVMKKRDGMSYEEIADKLGISAHTVKKYLYQTVAQTRAADWIL